MASYEVAVFFFTTENTEEEVFKIFLKPYVHKVLFDFSLRVAFGFSVYLRVLHYLRGSNFDGLLRLRVNKKILYSPMEHRIIVLFAIKY